jgi:EmrB/QacA subfamily drug resistance transporter
MPDNVESTTQESAGRVYTHAERMRVVTGIILCILLAALDQTVVLPAIPQMAASLHGVGHISWVVSAYLLTTTATTPIYGKLSDQLGRRVVLLPALVFFLLACVFCALATSVFLLILARALQGVGGGALLAVSQAAVADVIPPRERGRYQAWFAATWAFSSVAGPIAGGLLTEHLSWRWIFWCNLPIGALALVLSARGLAGLKPAGLKSKIDYPGAVLLLASVGAILLALSTGGVDFAWVSTPLALLVLAGAALGAALIAQQRRAAAPLFPAGLIAQADFRGILTISFLNAASMFGAIFLLPLMLQWLYHASPAASGVELVPFLFTSTAGAFTAGQITRRTGTTRPVLIGGLALAAAGFLLLALNPAATFITYPLVISAIFGFGIGAIMPTSLVTAQTQASRRDVGAATGTLLLLRAMGGAFGATLAGAILTATRGNSAEGFRAGFLACAALQTLATVAALKMSNITLRTTVEAAVK